MISAGSTRGLGHGADELIARLTNDPRAAELVLAGGGLTPELVPVAGPGRLVALRDRVRGSHRRNPATRASVDIDHVRSWRMLLDDALSRALGIPTD